MYAIFGVELGAPSLARLEGEYLIEGPIRIIMGFAVYRHSLCPSFARNHDFAVLPGFSEVDLQV